MKKFVSTVAAFITATLAAAITASIFSTQFVIAGLRGLGVEVEIYTRLSMTFGDLAILQSLAIVVAAGFLVAFLIAWALSSQLGGSRRLWYAVAGGASVISTLLIMSAIMQLMPVAGARTSLGMLMQGMAGALGGFVYAQLTMLQHQSDIDRAPLLIDERKS